MNKQDIIRKITEKKEFSNLPRKDVEMAFEMFDKERYVDEEKVKLTRDLLRKVFSGFTSQKLLTLRDKEPEWFLKKHLSTRERFSYYSEVYKRIFKNIKEKNKKLSVIDLGAGVNGFSYSYFEKIGKKVNYIGIEAVGQLVSLANKYFDKEKIRGKVVHESLFGLEKIKNIISESKKPRVVFLFKTLDSLEMLKRDYSKKLLLELRNDVDIFVVSFATRSMIRRREFRVSRKWILDFINKEFKVLDDFELGGERYIVFKK